MLALVVGAPATVVADPVPLSWDVGGYFRTRLARIRGIPRKNPDFLSPDPRDLSAGADFGVMRLRLLPVLRYGADPDKPVASMHLQIDGFDNVVFGDNALLTAKPVFADPLSATDIDGVDIDTFEIERAWLQLSVPVGQLRVGRMPSHWGLGLLANGATGMDTDWGDPMGGSSNDRLLFATRPLTIANVLMDKGDASTPLIVVAAYDKLVEDPHDPLSDPPRGALPFVPWSNAADDVQQVVLAAVWNDPELNAASPEDELTAGVYFVNRWQESSESDLQILDLFWRLRYSPFGSDRPALMTSGEILTIQGESRSLSEGTLTEPNIWGGVVKLGAETECWTGIAEAGYASGDAIIADGDFTGRPIHRDYHVGMVLYPIVLAARSAHTFGDETSLWSKGGVYNSSYLFPQARWRPIPGLELVGAFLAAWADELTPVLGGSDRSDGSTACSLFQGDCFLGWEIDAAVKVRWGEDDLVRWSTELGILSGGEALESVLTEPTVWTVQSRIAMVW